MISSPTVAPVVTTEKSSSNQFLQNCPDCGEKLRPYGSDMLAGENGGCYFKLCEGKCKKAFVVSKSSHSIEHTGTLEEIIEIMRFRRHRGKQ